MARAEVVTPVRSLTEPVEFGGRSFTEGCELRIESLAPYRHGLVLRELVPQLTVFPDPASWSVRLRRATLMLPPQDAELINRELEAYLAPYASVVDEYLTT
jgi:hypothetical protein